MNSFFFSVQNENKLFICCENSSLKIHVVSLSQLENSLVFAFRCATLCTSHCFSVHLNVFKCVTLSAFDCFSFYPNFVVRMQMVVIIMFYISCALVQKDLIAHGLTQLHIFNCIQSALRSLIKKKKSKKKKLSR
jgi:hypothetical protein